VSHTLHQESQMTDERHIATAVGAVGGEVSEATSARFYDKSEHEGVVVQLPGWRYPVIVKAGGELAFDTYRGRWGDEAVLDRLRQEYAFAVTKDVYETEYDGCSVEHMGYNDDGELQFEVHREEQVWGY